MKTARVIAMGIAGLVIAVTLSLSAFAITGGSIGEPVRPVSVPSGGDTKSGSDLSRTPAPAPEPSDDHGGASQQASTSTASPSVGSSSESSSNDHDGDD